MNNYKDTSNYYGNGGEFEPINIMEFYAEEWTRRGIPPKVVTRLTMALKYLLRLGSKDDHQKELFKAENYIHRARCNKWMPAESTKILDNCCEKLKQIHEDINAK